MKSSNYDLNTLNQPQLEAVLYQAGPLLVLAGAGSGKTRVITYRIARMIRDGIPAQQILAVTFTNKTAKEMRERIKTLTTKKEAESLTICTFHALGHKLLRECASQIGLVPQFSIMDEGDRIGMMRKIMRQTNIDDKKFDVHILLRFISLLKNRQRNMTDYERQNDDYSILLQEVYPRYQSLLQTLQSVDFDDLLLKPLQMFLDYPNLADFYRNRFSHVLVDEYQDTNPVQFELLQQLCPAHSDLCVVGDDDQSIYGFRGANVQHILEFTHHYQGAKEIKLTQNYRSSGHILKAANHVISHNQARKQKSMWTSSGEGENVHIHQIENDTQEAEFVCRQISRLISQFQKKPADIAILYRSNIQSRLFEEALRLEHLPYRVVGGMDYFERKEIKDTIAYLRVLDNDADEMSMRRIINYPGRGIGDATIEKIADAAKQEQCSFYHMLSRAHALPIAQKTIQAIVSLHAKLESTKQLLLTAQNAAQVVQILDTFLTEIGIFDVLYQEFDNLLLVQRKTDNIRHMLKFLDTHLNKNNTLSMTTFLADMSLDVPEEDKKKDDDEHGITLSTIHAAKGLEWPFVFIVGVEEDILPHKKTIQTIDGDLDEERRLFYVAMTRARQRLWISYCKNRQKYGSQAKRTASRFLDNLDQNSGVVHYRAGQDAPVSETQQDELARSFFESMKAKLGI